MDTEKWQQLETVWNKVLDLCSEARESFLEQIRKDDPEIYYRVTELLDAIKEAEDTLFLESGSSENAELFKEINHQYQINKATGRLIGKHIGPFTLTEFLGRGGMAVVYKGERREGSFNQTVAVKILNKNFHSEENILRFRTEQQILSRLNHPHIARLTDGGITHEGNPYLVMEYVDGIPITEYCKSRELGHEEYLALYKDLCVAVNYAHRNLIVHRDLKPDNILVTGEGKVKVLDFSIAKLLDTEFSDGTIIQTQTGIKLLSPSYCAPEQFRNEPITTSTDVFALGLLLYELATGQKAVNSKGKNLSEIETLVCNADFSRPKDINAEVNSELESIILKALRQEPEYRYDSAGQLLEDLNRYEKSLPLIAQKDTVQYRVKTFVNRHKTALILSISILLTLLLLTAVYTNQITRERNQARAEANKAAQMTSFLIKLFEASDPTEARGDTVTARELLKRGLERTKALENQPEVQSQMLETMGRVYRRLGQYEKSDTLLRRALAIRKKTFGLYHRETTGSLDHLGMLLSDKGNYSAAESMLQQSLKIQTKLRDPDHPAVAKTQNLLAYALRKQGKYAEAEHLYKSSLKIRQDYFGEGHPLTITAMSSLGAVLHNKGEYKETEKLFREVLTQRRQLLGPVHPDVAMSMNNLAALLMNTGQLEEAKQLLHEALNMRQKIYGSRHPKVALSMNNLAMVLRDLEDFAASESLFSQALAMRTELLGNSHVATAVSWFGLGELMLRTDYPDSALTLFSQALTVFTEKLSGNHSFTARTKMCLGSAYQALGHPRKAKQLLQEGYKQILQIHPDSTLERALAKQRLGIFYFEHGHYNRARTLLKKAYATFRYIEEDTTQRQKNIIAYLNQLET